MALLNHTREHPADGWRFLVRETGTWIRADIHDEIVTAVIDHRLYKNIPGSTDREEVSLEIQRQICLGAPPGQCHAERGETYIPFKDMARTLSLMKIAAFSETLMEWLKSGLNMVPKEESERRANICRGCPFNRPAPNCVCTPFYKMIDALIPVDRKLGGLYVCGLCGCAISAKSLAPLSVVHQGNPENLRLPEWCWQKQPTQPVQP